MLKFFLTVFLLVAVPASAQQHWCDKDRSRFNSTERAICATPNLVTLDKQMARAFFTARDRLSGTQRERFQDSQFKFWLPYRNACQRDRACLIQRYNARIVELTGSAQPNVLTPPDGLAPVGTQGMIRVTREGYLEYRDALTNEIKVFNPKNLATGTRRGSRIDWPNVTYVAASPLDLPDLSFGNTRWVDTALRHTNTLLDGLLSVEAAAIVRNSAPSDTPSGRTAYYLRMLNRILELQL